MTWTETHRRWQALRAIEAQLAEQAHLDLVPELPWSAQYADIFGDRQTLLAQLRYRHEMACHVQLDPQLPEDVLAEQRRLLAARTRGVRLVLDAAAREEEGSRRVA